MKSKFLILLFSFAVFSNINAQNAAPALSTYQPENPGWLTNLDEAYAKSKKENKAIMANFTGSDWCGWCKKLTASVFAQPEFKTWADKNVVLLELDYPRRKELPEVIRAQNQNLQQAFQVSGYPTVFIFDLNKDEAKNQYSINALGRTGYKPSVGEFTSEVTTFLANRTAAAGGK